MNDHPVSIAQALAGFEVVAPSCDLSSVKTESRRDWRQRGRRRGRATDRVARIGGVIEDGDTHLFAGDLAGVIAPVRGLAPQLLFAHQPFRVGDVGKRPCPLAARGAGGCRKRRPFHREVTWSSAVRVRPHRNSATWDRKEGHHEGFGEDRVFAFNIGPFEVAVRNLASCRSSLRRFLEVHAPRPLRCRSAK